MSCRSKGSNHARPLSHVTPPLFHSRPSKVCSLLSFSDEVENMEKTRVNIFDRFISFFGLILSKNKPPIIWMRNGANFEAEESFIRYTYIKDRVIELADRYLSCPCDSDSSIEIQDEAEKW